MVILEEREHDEHLDDQRVESRSKEAAILGLPVLQLIDLLRGHLSLATLLLRHQHDFAPSFERFVTGKLMQLIFIVLEQFFLEFVFPLVRLDVERALLLVLTAESLPHALMAFLAK